MSRGRTLRAVATALVAVAAMPSGAHAALRVSDALDLADPASPVSAGDFNGDGLGDLLDRNGVTLGVRGGVPGPGTPRVDIGAPQSPLSFARYAALGDVDGDGYDDVTFVRPDGQWIVYGGPGSGPIALVPSARVSETDQDLTAVGDLDGDGDDEAIATGRGTGSAWQLFQGGPRVPVLSGAATPARVTTIAFLRACESVYRTILGVRFFVGRWCENFQPPIVAPGDLNGDGRDDLFFPDVVDRGTPDIGRGYGAILLGRATLPATINPLALGSDGVVRVATSPQVPPATIPLDPLRAERDQQGPSVRLVLGDVTGDGIDDLPLRVGDTAWILPGRRSTAPWTTEPAARLTVPLARPAGDAATSRAVRSLTSVDDQNGDGIRDMVNESVDALEPLNFATTVVLRSGGPPGSTSALLPSSLEATDLRAVYPAGDLDGDGSADLVAGILCEERRAVALSARPDRRAPQLTTGCGARLPAPPEITPQTVRTGAASSLRVAVDEAATLRLDVLRGSQLIAGESRAVPRGSTTLPWDDEVGGTTLAPGGYTLRVTPRDSAGNASPAREVPFAVASAAETVLKLAQDGVVPTSPRQTRVTIQNCGGPTSVVGLTPPPGWTIVAPPTLPQQIPGACVTTNYLLELGPNAADGDFVIQPSDSGALRVPLTADRSITARVASVTPTQVTVQVTNTGYFEIVPSPVLPRGWTRGAGWGGATGPQFIPHGVTELVLGRGAASADLVFDPRAARPAGVPPAWAPAFRVALTGLPGNEPERAANLVPTVTSLTLIAGFNRSTRSDVAVQNAGAGPGEITTVAVDPAGRLRIEASTCGSSAAPITLPPGGRCTVTVAFRPGLSTATATATLRVNDVALPVTGRVQGI